ncbi:MAG: GNAT family N-acetyltransferase [Actinomycetota bacterium]
MKLVWDLPLDPAGIDLELGDGSRVRIRPGRTGDGPALRGAFERFSEQSRYYRFFTPTPRLTPGAEDSLTAVDDDRQYAWGVFDPSEASEVDDESGLAVGVARLFIDADDPEVAEATLAVVDAYQGRGLGGLLMELLLSTASILELRSLRFDVLAENRAMRGVLHGLGAQGAALPDDRTIVRYDLPVPQGEVDPTIGALYVLLRAAGEAAANDAAD